jgi:hypothetical protein
MFNIPVVGNTPCTLMPRSIASRPVDIIESFGTLSTRWSWHVTESHDGSSPVHDVRHFRHGVPAPETLTGPIRGFRALFLPEGYPQSVSSDYTQYQICDSIQALCSSVTGTLSTRAILKGVGVGEAEATALGGLLQWVLRDGVGMVGRIAFATVISSDLDHDAKRWRLAADITNDAGLLLEILSSHLPTHWFLTVVCLANLFKAVTCVAGGATRASLTQHFAVRQNMADVAAKDGSQETAVNLVGMFVGMAVAAVVPETFGWTLIVALCFIVMHLGSNYLGVKSLILNTLNESRLLICLDRLLVNGTVPTPIAVRSIEPVVLPLAKPVTVRMGASLRRALAHATPEFRATHVTGDVALATLRTKKYVVVPQASGAVAVVMTADCDADPLVILQAYLAALVAAMPARYQKVPTLATLTELLTGAGWRLDRVQFRLDDYRVEMGSHEE